MTLWLLGQDQPEMWMVGEGIVAWKERIPGLVYLDVALVPDSPISEALDRSINLAGPHFSNYKVSSTCSRHPVLPIFRTVHPTLVKHLLEISTQSY